jgi:hypothetical protein
MLNNNDLVLAGDSSIVIAESGQLKASTLIEASLRNLAPRFRSKFDGSHGHRLTVSEMNAALYRVC